MKLLKKLLKWSIIPLIFQLSVLLYIDQIYLNQSLHLKISKGTLNDTTANAKKINVDLPSDAKMTSVSYDGRYVSYYNGTELNIINTQNRKKSNISFPSNVTVTYYKWLPDRDRLLIAERHKSNGYYFTISYYDTRDNEKIEYANSKGGTIKIPVYSSKYKVDAITVSTLTNAQYIKISIDGHYNKIYRIDANVDAVNVLNSNYNMGTITTLNRLDRFIYENLTTSKIRILNKGYLDLTLKNPRILGVDGEDNLYLGNSNNGYIKSVYYCNMDVKNSEWMHVNLEKEIPIEDVYITSKGTILINDELSGTIKNVLTGKSVKYSGKFISIFKDGIISQIDGKIVGQDISTL